jgi:hypothetical protein
MSQCLNSRQQFVQSKGLMEQSSAHRSKMAELSETFENDHFAIDTVHVHN